MNPANEPNLVEPTSRLLDLDPIDEVDSEELKMAAAFDVLATQLQGKPEAEVQHMLHKASSESLENHAEMVGGLIYGMITDGKNAEQWLHYMNFVVRDGYAHAVGVMRYLVGLARFNRITNDCQRQLLWLLNHMVELSVPSMETVLLVLLRQLRGGDVTPQNIWLIGNTLELLMRHRDWLFTHPRLVSTSLYVYLRLMLDHAKFSSMLEREVAFCSCLLREKFLECSDIGRDLVRALQDVARIPEFEQIWRDLLVEPRKLSPHCKVLRLTLEMEQRILFILERLSWERHRRNLSWFVERYLTSPESDAIVSDVIRYIIGVYHPSNDVLASNIVPRYVVIGGLLRYIKSNVKPAILLMYKSLDKYAHMTGTLIEFLLYCIDEYYPPLQQVIRKHVHSALNDILQKNVINSLVPIVECSGIDSHVRDLARTTFHTLLAANPPTNSMTGANQPTLDLFSQPVETFPQGLADDGSGEILSRASTIGVDEQDESITGKTVHPNDMEILMSDEGEVNATLSGEEDEGEEEDEGGEAMIGDEAENELGRFDNEEALMEDEDDEEGAIDGESLWLLGGSVSEYRLAYTNRDTPKACQALKDMLVVFSSMAVPMDEFIPVIRRSIVNIAMETSDIPYSYLSEVSETDIDIVETLLNSCWENYMNNQEKVANVLHQLLRISSALSARWLLYLTKQYTRKETVGDHLQHFNPYLTALKAIQITDIKNRLVTDIQLIHEKYPEICFSCLSMLFQYLPDMTMGNEPLVHILVSVIEPNDLFTVTCNLITGQWRLFGNECQSVLSEMLLSWDTLEQMNAWQLLQAELTHSSEQADSLVLHLLQIIDSNVQQDALAGVLALLRGLPPTSELVQVILSTIQWSNTEKEPITIAQQFALTAFIQWHAVRDVELKESLKQWLDDQETKNNDETNQDTEIRLNNQWLIGQGLVRSIRQWLKRLDILDHSLARIAWKNGVPTAKKQAISTTNNGASILGNGSRRSSTSSVHSKSRSKKTNNDLFDAEESSNSSDEDTQENKDSSDDMEEEEEEEEEEIVESAEAQATRKRMVELRSEKLRRSTRTSISSGDKSNTSKLTEKSAKNEEDEDEAMDEDDTTEDEENEENEEDEKEEGETDEEDESTEDNEQAIDEDEDEDDEPISGKSNRRRRTRSMVSLSDKSTKTTTTTRQSKAETQRKTGKGRPKKRRILEDSD
ncbi:protein-domain-containing protein [Syncephalis fuscata]|nr:protein-domain-containing protein [Syncephalis fuscata]